MSVQSMETNKKQKDNRQIVLMSLEFFFFYGAMGFIQPYLSLKLFNLGMSGTQIGIISTASSLLTFLISPFMSVIYDNSRKKRLFTQTLLLISGVFYYLVGQIFIFWFVLGFIAISRICNSTIMPVTENLAYNISLSSQTKAKSKFGFIRQFGSLGYAVTAFIGGWILDVYNININFSLNLLFVIIVIVLISFLPVSTFDFAKLGHDLKEKIQSKKVLKVLTSNKYLLSMVLALAFFNLCNGMGQFETIFMSQLSISETMIGLAVTLTALLEIPFMLWADDLVVRLGVTRILTFVFIFELLRRILVYCFPFGWVVFWTRILMSISFGLRTVIVVSLINQQVPNKYSTSILTLVTVTLFGIFSMIGNGISGVIFDIYSAHELYLISGIICLISIGLSFYALIIEKKKIITA